MKSLYPALTRLIPCCQCLLLLVLLSSCGAYRNRVMFRTDADAGHFASALAEAHSNYVLQEYDYLELKVYTNGGELIIDPNQEIMKEMGGGGMAQQGNENVRFLVRKGGSVRLPLLGDVKVAGLTLQQADSLLEKQYAAFYEDAFVTTRYVNKRVVVLGMSGGQVIPLQHEGMHLIEVLALAGGMDLQARVDNIRLIRGELHNPEVHLIDLSTIEGMKKSSLKVLPGDIIYVEPRRSITTEAIREITPVFGFVTSLITLILLAGRIS